MSAVRVGLVPGWEPGKAEQPPGSVAFPSCLAGVVKARFIVEAKGCE